MSSSSSGPNRLWCWRRRIGRTDAELWIARLESLGFSSWAIGDKPGQTRLLLSVYLEDRARGLALVPQLGGRLALLKKEEWAGAGPSVPLRIGRVLEISQHAPVRGRSSAARHHLRIPNGMAFGSGEHATTRMLLRALTQVPSWTGISVLDLGTGSGVLALAARRLGAAKIVATDFDPHAIRTAKQNEALNFSTPLVRWRKADVKRLRTGTRHALVLANLFSGLLCEAAPRIAGSVADGGRLWLSGVLRSQEGEVVRAYRGAGLRLARIATRGKWIVLEGKSPRDRPLASYVSGGGLRNTTQTK